MRRTLRISVRLLCGPLSLALAAMAGCTGVHGTRSGLLPEVKTIASVGDRPQPAVTGPAGEAVAAGPEEATVRPRDDGRISGRVVDLRGRPVPNVRVRVAITGAARGQVVRAKTDASGAFTLHGLRPGASYTVIAESDDPRGTLTGRNIVQAPSYRVKVRLSALEGVRPADASGSDSDPRAPARAAAPRVSPISERDRAEDDEPWDEQGPDAPPAPRRPNAQGPARSRRINEEDLPPAPEAEDVPPGVDSHDRVGRRAGSRRVTMPRLAAPLPSSGWRRGSHAGLSEPAPVDPMASTSSTTVEASEPRLASEALPPANDEAAPDLNPGVTASASSSAPAPGTDPRAASDPSVEDDGPNPLPPAIEPGRPAPAEGSAPDASGAANRDQGPSPGLGAGTAPEPDQPAPAPGSSGSSPGAAPAPEPAHGPSEGPGPAERPNEPGPDGSGADPSAPAPPPDREPIGAEPKPEEPPAGQSAALRSRSRRPGTIIEGLASIASPRGVVSRLRSRFAPRSPSPEAAQPPASAGAKSPSFESPPAALEAEDAMPMPEPRPSLSPGPLPPPAEADPGFAPDPPAAPVAPAQRPRWGDLTAQEQPASATGPASPPLPLRGVAGDPAGPARPAGPVKAFCRYDGRRRELADFRLPDLQGRPVRFQDLDADLILLDFWGTWCGHCVRAIPHLVELQSRYGDRLKVVGIAYEEGPVSERAGHVLEVAQRLGINYTLLLGGLDGPCPLQSAFHVQVYPSMVLVNRYGRVLWRDQGATPATLDRLDRVLASAASGDIVRR